MDYQLSTRANENLTISGILTIGKPSSLGEIGMGSTSIYLHGKTEANYDYGTGSVLKHKSVPVKDCPGCEDTDCVTWSGIFQLTFRTAPTIELPGPSEYAHLSPCQQKRVRDWIKNVLHPHELQHKAAFKTYDGVVKKPFSMKVCRDERGGDLLQPIHDTEELRRRKAANALSDALDPFHSNIDLDCEDKETSTDEKTYLPSINS